MSEIKYKPLPVLASSPLVGEGVETGKEYWRSLDELADTPEFRKYLETEFPSKHELWMDPISRRDFMKLMGAGMAMMFFSGCRKPLEQIFPFNENPETQIPGKPLFYATAIPLGGYAQGVLVENHEGRPTKIEGNPKHPDSLGGTDVFMQAAILGLYDPDRSQAVMNTGIISSWDEFLRDLHRVLDAQAAAQGAGLRILTQTVTSPTLAAQMQAFQKRFPKARWHQYEPLGRHAALAGARMAFGQYAEPQYDFEKAQVILSLDSDFMADIPGKLRYARHFTAGRNLVEGRTTMNRLYVAEPSPTITGSSADHRLPVRACDIEGLARALAQELGAPGGASGSLPSADRWIQAVAKDLRSHKGRSLVIAGDSQPAIVHALAHGLNQALGNSGNTVSYIKPVMVQPEDQLASLKELVDDMQNKKVDALLVLGGNPLYDAPADIPFAAALEKVGWRAHVGLYADETSNLCHWHVPQAHSLESWGDLRASDGTISIVQPLIEPIYEGKTLQEVISALVEDAPRTAHDIVKGYWKEKSGTLDFENAWRTSLHNGIVEGTALSELPVSFKASSPLVGEDRGGGFAVKTNPPSQPSPTRGEGAKDALEIVFKPDPSVWDGSFANNGWLQELPKPMTKLTWDNAALMSPDTAKRLGFDTEDVVLIEFDGRSVQAPVWMTPGHADNSVTLSLGYGRTHAGKVGNGKGFNAYALRTSGAMGFGTGIRISKTGQRYKLSSTDTHQGMEGRDIVRGATLAEYRSDPKFAYQEKDYPKSDDTLYNSPAQDMEVGWGMTIDMNACIGCNACVIGCQAENNISIVGKEEVARGREMHWIRVDNYFSGDPAHPDVTHQPVPCMHCEDAPCEPVCPVGATVHNDEGLNEMVYNRCVGTRYCSNNCPYKVRRFNFFQYADNETELLKFMRNPDVTVRERGVMEKCTYCVQRINAAKITAEKEDRPVGDGEIVTACQGACPTRAITFGNIRDKKSQVARLKAEPRNYAMLGELGVRPRTTYLAKVRNPNPDLEV